MTSKPCPYNSQPAKGINFYNRKNELETILHASENIHLVGMRGAGKTSLLLKIKTIVPSLYFTFQSMTGEFRQFQSQTYNALTEMQQKYPWLPQMVNNEADPFEAIHSAAIKAQQEGVKLFLLFDEAEGLFRFNTDFLQRLSDYLNGIVPIKVILASAKNISTLNDQIVKLGSSPLLLPDTILYVSRLADKDATDLICQNQSAEPLSIPLDIIETIQQHTNNQPHLIQWLCTQLWSKSSNPQTWNITKELLHLRNNQLADRFKADFYYLSPQERLIIKTVLENQPLLDETPSIMLNVLTNLGYLQYIDTQYKIGNTFLLNWFQDNETQLNWQDTTQQPTDEATNKLYGKIKFLNEPQPKLALVMMGGGVKGLAYVGALKELEPYYPFDWYVGTSAGSIAATLLAAGYKVSNSENDSKQEKDLEEISLEEILYQKDFSDFLNENCFKKLYNIIFHHGIHTGSSFETWIYVLLQKKLGRKGGIGLYQLDKKRLTIYACCKGVDALIFDSNGKNADTPISHAVRCSMSIPIFFTPVDKDGKLVFDGGMLHNYPIDIFRKYNGDVQFVGLYLGQEISQKDEFVLNSYLPFKADFIKYVPFGAVISDILAIWWGASDEYASIAYQEHTVFIDTEPITTTDFSLSTEEKDFLIKAGQVAALKYLMKYNSEAQTKISKSELKKEEEYLENKRQDIKQLRREKRKWRLLKIPSLCSLIFLIIVLGIFWVVYT